MLLNLPFPLTDKLLPRLRTPREDARVTVAAAASSDWTTVVSFKLASNERGFLVRYAAEVQDPTYDYGGSLGFQVVVDGNSVAGNFSTTSGGFYTERRGSLVLPADIVQYVQPGNTVSLRVRRILAAAAPQAVAATLQLVLWPVEVRGAYPTARTTR